MNAEEWEAVLENYPPVNNGKRRRIERQKPRSAIARDIANKGLEEGLIVQVGNTKYAYKEFTSVIREDGVAVGSVRKFQYVKV